jgi:hypothetical protein
MAKKQKSFADKASGNKNSESVYVKYVKSIKSKKSGRWRFNEQIVRTMKGEQLDAALKRMDEIANLVDIDLSQFSGTEVSGKEVPIEKDSKKDVSNDQLPLKEKPKENVKKSKDLKVESPENANHQKDNHDEKVAKGEIKKKTLQ